MIAKPWSEKETEVLMECVRKSGVRPGCREAASLLGRSVRAAESHYYAYKEKVNDKPKSSCGSQEPRKWTPEEDALLLELVRKAKDKRSAFREAGKRLGRSFHCVETHYYRVLKKIGNKSDASLEDLLAEKASGGTLKKEDIQEVADRAGVHYHTALSTWGSMNAKLPSKDQVILLLERARDELQEVNIELYRENARLREEILGLSRQVQRLQRLNMIYLERLSAASAKRRLGFPAGKAPARDLAAVVN